MTPIPPVLVRGAGVLHDPPLRGAHRTRAAIRRDQVGVRAEAELGRQGPDHAGAAHHGLREAREVDL